MRRGDVFRLRGSTSTVRVLLAALAAAGASLVAADPQPARSPDWVRVDEKATGERSGSVLLRVPDSDRLLLVGPAEGAPFVQAFDASARTWSRVADGGPAVERFHPYYQAAYHPGTRTVYCLSGGDVLHAFSLADGTWTSLPPAPELAGLSWHAMACDARGGRLVAIGADKKAGSIGWTRTLVHDIATGAWSRVEVEDAEAVRARRELEALANTVAELVGRARLAWLRDPDGRGSDAERRELSRRVEALALLPRAAGYSREIDSMRGLLSEKRTLEALREARALLGKVEDAAEAALSVPRSRRNSPLAFDEKTGKLVLFGGDHEDYLMNDTWVLDLEKRAWKRMSPDVAPSPRAGHALFPLPRSGGVALYEGYVQTTSTDYGAAPWAPASPIQLWRYEVASDRWDLLGSWPLPRKGEVSRPPPTGHFDGYAAEWYSPPAIAADSSDRLILAAHPGRTWYLRWNEFPVRTWLLDAAALRPDADGRTALGRPSGERLSRGGPFAAAYCEVPDRPEPTRLDGLPENRWMRLPDSPRNPCSGCRQRDWGTATWDSDRDQILMWGGGHCVRSASTVVHWSPASGRLAEGFDADEPYGANGGGGFDSSVLNRPWVSAHNYNHYAYDPRCRLLVSGRGYLYDPDRMDWLRIEPYPLPFVFEWGNTVVETSPRGAVAWARRRGPDGAGTDDFGLWIFDREKGWIDLEPKGALFGPYCDAHGMVWDSKRDRLVLSGVGGGYEKVSDGSFLSFDLETRSVAPIAPENRELARTRNARELAYVVHADWIVIGELLRTGEEGTGKGFTRIWDCGRNRMFLLDAGDVPDGHSTGWLYDAQRKLVYVFTFRGEVWALRLEPRTARLLETTG